MAFQFLKYLMILGLLPCLQGLQYEDDDPSHVIRTPQGLLRGAKETTNKGSIYFSFQSIPYAKAPIGSLRFKDPEVWEGWQGVRNATTPPEKCAQFHEGYGGVEDCLYLNVFAPQEALDSDEHLPVMMFIHGGEFKYGWAELYNPKPLMESGIIVVTIQYRLGIFGFLSTEDSVIPGNFALKDQNMALRWIQHNIRYFGGDPLSVTIFGQSAGAASVHLQVLSPYSSGLFSRAIIQSGSATTNWALGSDFKKIATKIGRDFNCSTESKELLVCLQQVDAEALVDSLQQFYGWHTFPNHMSPRIDGFFLPDEPQKMLREGRHNHVDILTGTTKDDGAFVAEWLASNETRFNDFIQNYSRIVPLTLETHQEEKCDEILSRILVTYAGSPTLSISNAPGLEKLYVDYYYKTPVDLHAYWHINTAKHTNKKVFIYELQHIGQYSIYEIESRTKVYHADDLFYPFNFAGLDLEQPDDIEVRNVIVNTWANFAKFGNPTPDNSLGFEWRAAELSNMEYLAIKPSPNMENFSRESEQHFWTHLPMRWFSYLQKDEDQETQEQLVFQTTSYV